MLSSAFHPALPSGTVESRLEKSKLSSVLPDYGVIDIDVVQVKETLLGGRVITELLRGGIGLGSKPNGVLSW